MFSEPPQLQVTNLYVDDTPVELADEIEHGKALILEKLDALTELRTKLRQDYVPLTVCTHLEQCIKETEVRTYNSFCNAQETSRDKVLDAVRVFALKQYR